MKVDEFETKVKTIRAKLLGVAVQQLPCKEEAEDLVQESLLRLWYAQEQWSQYQNLEAVAMRTLRNLIIDRYRKSTPQHEAIERCVRQSHEPNAQQLLEARENRERLINIIQQLPNLQRLIITMKDLEDYEIKEIAQITQSSVESIRMNLSRARKKIKELFYNHINDA
ncbi:MAG: RNA polymerase sigma factor [Bacteroidales bacterium]|jgi:RNA polymerase sigma-70 factor (ECF subfamily)|nr:RNA polymerase sigma factor [Bacteroidales bacterium]